MKFGPSENTDGDILLKDHAILWVGYNVLQQNTQKDCYDNPNLLSFSICLSFFFIYILRKHVHVLVGVLRLTILRM